MALTPVLTDLVGAGLAGVAVWFWPQIMSVAREQLVPWVDRHIPELADSVRLAFSDLEKVAAGLRRAARSAWGRLRHVLVSQTAEFVGPVDGEWVIRVTSCLRHLEQTVQVVTEQVLDRADLPDEVRAATMSNGLGGTFIDIVKARDRLLEAA